MYRPSNRRKALVEKLNQPIRSHMPKYPQLSRNSIIEQELWCLIMPRCDTSAVLFAAHQVLSVTEIDDFQALRGSVDDDIS